MLFKKRSVLKPRIATRCRGFFFGGGRYKLIALLVLTALAYLPGLKGPFLFDDQPNLRVLSDWHQGTTGWMEALLGNRSGPIGRPLSMLSFMFNEKLFGSHPLSFKVTNLAIHLICGILIYCLIIKLVRKDPQLDTRASCIALFVTAIWLLHPLHVSTVLYIVQRMAQLSAIFTLIAMLIFLKGREELDLGLTKKAACWLFVAFPSATIAGILCKENAALAPLLCAVIEIVYFNRPRHFLTRIFFACALGVPTIAAVFWYLPERLVQSYSVRTFTLTQRLLSEPRALFDYMAALIIPRGPTLGVYTDDFPVSSDLLHPVTTSFALCGLIALTAFAIFSIRRMPTVCFGILFYLAGHALESSIFPLELYFEHRNYLPSTGFILALTSAIILTLIKIRYIGSTALPPRTLIYGSILLCLTLGLATTARAWVWQSWTTIVGQANQQHPNSTRAQFDHLSITWSNGDFHKTQNELNRIIAGSNRESRNLALVYEMTFKCQNKKPVTQDDRASVQRMAGSKIQLADMQTFEQAAGYLRNHNCPGLSPVQLGDILRHIIDEAPQPNSNTPIWRTRFAIANLYAIGGKPALAESEASKAWLTGVADPAVGILLARLQLFNGHVEAAIATREQTSDKIKNWDRRNLYQIQILDSLIKKKKIQKKI